MIEVFFYSIAGKKTNSTVDDLLQQFIDSDVVPDTDKKIIEHTINVAKNGNYPSTDYYETFYDRPAYTTKSLAEIVTYAGQTLDFYNRASLEKRIISAINDSNTSADLISAVDNVISVKHVDDSIEFDEFAPALYSDQESTAFEGYPVGIPEIDNIAHGFEPGTILSICAYTGHGKSTTNVSMLFKNIIQGKKVCLFSLEMNPKIVWLQFQARYLYEVKGLTLSAEDLIKHRLSSDMEAKVKEYEDDFKKEVASNLIILDESVLDKKTVLNYKNLSRRIRAVEKRLGGLDIVSWDHIHQLELLYPDCGNMIIKQIQSVAKTYKSDSGNQILMVLLVQCNREGEKRARKRQGAYDLQAIGDLNEVERSSTYVMFLYTNDDMKVVQETKVQLAKNRLGAISAEPATTTFNPQVLVVGTTVESITADDNMLSEIGDMGGAFDSFNDEF